jgi:hypothetical protein
MVDFDRVMRVHQVSVAPIPVGVQGAVILEELPAEQIQGTVGREFRDRVLPPRGSEVVHLVDDSGDASR